MEKSAIILAGGFSSRFGQDKGLVLLANKPLVAHVLDAINKIVDEKIVVVSSKTQAESYTKALGSEVKVFIDEGKVQSPLVGALKGFKEVRSEYALLLPCDTPLLSKDILLLLFDLCPNKNAVIPRWPNGYIEPLQAVYRTKPALEAAEKALNEESLNMQAMVDKLRGIRYVSTLVLRQLDPELKSFFNVNTPMDLKKAEQILKKKG
ncbi:MAG: molybdenum cofactor guanylyltransferase [Candidatus Bathycorpusculaceae bacterium]